MTFKQVVEYQRAIAHTAPCQVAEECGNPRYFFHVYPAQFVSCGVWLTVNVGEE